MGAIRNALLVATGVVGVVLTGSAHAAVKYEFTALSSFGFGQNNNEQFTGNFTYIAPSFIDPASGFANEVVVQAADLISCSATSSFGTPTICRQQGFLRDISPNTVTVSFGVENVDTSVGIFYYFDPVAFTTAGTYDTVIFGADQAGRLIVTDLGPNAVPEASTWSMLIAGFGLVGMALRGARRRREARLTFS